MDFLAGYFNHEVIRAFPGGSLRIKIAKPAIRCAGIGRLRVIAERHDEDITELVLSYEDYKGLNPPKRRSGKKDK